MDIDLLIAPYGLKENKANQPNPTQQRVLDWVDSVRSGAKKIDGIPILYIQGGVGSGKTRALLAPTNEMLLEIPNLRVLWGRQDFNDLRLSAMETFFEVMPPELIVSSSVQEHRYKILQNNNQSAQIFFKGLKDLSGLGSQEFGLIVVTEAHEISLQAYRTLKMRVRQVGVPVMILLEGNPPNEEHWLNKITNPTYEDYDSDIEMWQISTYENWDNLPEAYRNSLESMPQSWKNKYLYGHFGFMPDGTPYYDGFKENIHVGEFEWNSERELLCGWDFGYHHPAVIITQMDLQDKWIWLREIIGNETTIYKFADKVTGIINELYPNARLRHYGDPAVVQKNDKSEHTSWQILNSKGITIRHRTSEYRMRKEIMEGKLGTLIGGKPAIMLDKRFCKTAIDGFLGGYHYPQHKEGQSFGDQFEQPFKDGFYEHIMNAGEYIAVNLFKPFTSNFHRTKIKQRGYNGKGMI